VTPVLEVAMHGPIIAKLPWEMLPLATSPQPKMMPSVWTRLRAICRCVVSLAG
jgi:hypothetical protein